jgi:UDP-glucose 4-epimerase
MPPGEPISVAISGAQGHLGRVLVPLLTRDPTVERVHWVEDGHAGEPELDGVDVAVHLAWVPPAIGPSAHDDGNAVDANLAATRRFLSACGARRVRRVLVASSTAAYGAWPDNPVPIPEEQWVRADQPAAVGRAKALVEDVCRQWAELHAYATLILVRPCPVVGPMLAELRGRAALLPRLFLVPEGAGLHLQFVHEDDVGRALVALCRRGPAGAYNLAGDGVVDGDELASLFGRRAIAAPAAALRDQAALWRLLGLEATAPDAGAVGFLVHPWVVDNRRIKATVGFEFRHDSRGAITELARCLRG